ncbi:DUF1080 domain-containing protein [Paraglaciecola sp. L3A3]|uniref:3-keto-disaccharide hydrolase n=1 Tax=Paraglaciecola sp. L3A3 TaxID=2686358 RepID=UPI0018EED13C|nr:DUF1080 domain-containing protein [Paraglaciecola sp. L3A3]
MKYKMFFIVCATTLLAGCQSNEYSGVASLATAKTVSLFDGKTFNGWKTADPAKMHLWSIEDGVITTGNYRTKARGNTYLRTEKEFADFEFKCLFRLSGDPSTGLINSGIQYRSNGEPRVVGYQADIGDGYWGDIYDEHRRGLLVKADLSILSKTLVSDAWNSYTIHVEGNRHRLYINDILTADYIEQADVPQKGYIAVQLHSGGKAKVEFKDLTITEL